MIRYTVTAERGQGPIWVLQCQQFPGAISESRRLADADRLMREAISYVAEVDPDTIEIDLQPILPGDLEAEIQHARAAVTDAEQRQRAAATLSRKAARDLKSVDLTGADIATVLGISPQRVSQLVNS